MTLPKVLGGGVSLDQLIKNCACEFWQPFESVIYENKKKSVRGLF